MCVELDLLHSLLFEVEAIWEQGTEENMWTETG
jgi:hypothetical protein